MAASNRIKIDGRNCRQIADECAKIVGKSAHFNLYGYLLTFDACDAEELSAVLLDAHNHWMRMRKPSLAKAAEVVRAKVFEVIASERTARSFS
jgi:hypothetical protein